MVHLTFVEDDSIRRAFTSILWSLLLSTSFTHPPSHVILIQFKMGIRHVLGVNLTVQFTALHAVKNSRYTEVKSKSAKKRKLTFRKQWMLVKNVQCVYICIMHVMASWIVTLNCNISTDKHIPGSNIKMIKKAKKPYDVSIDKAFLRAIKSLLSWVK